MCSYIFVAIAYGIMMEEAGLQWYYSLLASTAIYTGALQFVLTTLLSSGASILTIALTTLLMNSRQTFYSLTFVGDFRRMGRKKLYMIHTMTDETYAVNCSLDMPEEDKHRVMFYVAVMSKCSWVVGSVIGGVVGQLIPFELEGIDFSMTALFAVIFIEQWEKAEKHYPALIGLGVGVVCLLIFGQSAFMLPALLISSAMLMLMRKKEGAE